MAKSRKIRKSKAPVPEETTRRDMLKLMRNGALGVVTVGGVGYWAAGSFRAYAAEHDLSRMGQGAPAIVQVHDPHCPICTALQKQTRAALKGFDDCGLIYLVADINTPEGASLAARHGVPHVTLLFFDRDGELLRSVNGMHSEAQLSPMIADHKAAT
ncbi:YbbN family protein [Roseobacter weihaiensis]|uniref:hypothetical protein n=1 Tax=Roseobacter weihaiensis TaxID=2763262 RepID=UPI001D0A2266|nr:hypothetical protein [Roseobacter sp. H9]